MAKGISQSVGSMSFRQRMLFFVAGLIFLSSLGSALSLYQMHRVRHSLDAINRVLVPMGRLIAQMKSDADVYRRESEKNIGVSHWSDMHWKAQAVPRWIDDLLDYEGAQINSLLKSESDWSDAKTKAAWLQWSDEISELRSQVKVESKRLSDALISRNEEQARIAYPKLSQTLDHWLRQVRWGAEEYDRTFQEVFSRTESRVADLKTGLETIVIAILFLSLLLIGFGETALRPLRELTDLARSISSRGLKKEDKNLLIAISQSKTAEIQQLTQEFHHMATSLLEWEKTVETQKSRLEMQNLKLRELSDLKDRLRQAENLASVGRLSAQVAHEVRNPLHSIGLEAEIALEMALKLENSELKHSIQSILEGVERLEKITDNYLRLSRVSSGKKVLFDVGEVLERVLATYSPIFQSSQVQIDWKFTGSDVGFFVNGDADLFEQAIGNLIRNAIQAIEGASEPKIAIRLELNNHRVLLEIRDNGAGVSTEVRDRIFTPFVTTKAQGTGLGLSFVKQVATDHAGEIKLLDSTAEYPGACFMISLPSAEERATLNADAIPPRFNRGENLDVS